MKAKCPSTSLAFILIIIPWLFNVHSAEPITIGIAVGAAISLSGSIISFEYLKCKMYECCDDGWLTMNTTSLRADLRQRLYGQHLVIDTVVRALKAHINNKNPKKALVISFHGWTGSGKNYVADMIAQHFYFKGRQSNYVRLFLSKLISDDKCGGTKEEDCIKWLQSIVVNTVKQCPRSLFLFDEVDELDPRHMNALKPFLDYHGQLYGLDFRRSIFIFMSNTGSDDISARTFSNWKLGLGRNNLTLAEMERIIIYSAYNENGGLHLSELIKNNLIDHFVPFLPLERSHVLLCIKDYLRAKDVKVTDEDNFILRVADSLQYQPKNVGLFSSSGCKRVAQKVELLLQEELDAKEEEEAKEHSTDDSS